MSERKGVREGLEEISQRTCVHICTAMDTDHSVVKVGGRGWVEGSKGGKWGTSVIVSTIKKC